MKTKHSNNRWLALAVLALFNLQLPPAFAQGTAFSYQGRLDAGGSPANGIYDLQFTLWDGLTNGSAIAGPLTNNATPVSSGLFTVTLDFGSNRFAGQNLWLDIQVRTNGGSVFTPLVPRQLILPAPYAMMAGTSSNLSGTVSASQVSGSLPATQLSGTIPLGQLPGEVVTNNGSGVNLSGTFSGNGSGLTNLPASGAVVWQMVTGSAQQAESNRGYVATGTTTTTITLPAAPAVGDIVRVAGAGGGGWKIAQNLGQSVLWGAFGQTFTNWNSLNLWVSRASSGNWYGIASSSDGTKLVACQHGGYIFTSANSGTNWVPRFSAGSGNWHGVASSADGVRLAACQLGGYVFTSTDSGTNWFQRPSAGGANWFSVASSADGAKLVACQAGGYVYTSADSGANWVQRPSAGGGVWYGLASSADGTHLVAGQSGGYIYTSTDSGTNWVQRPSAGGGNWYSFASSADGTQLVASQDGGYIYTSTDSGTNWVQRTSAGGGYWKSIASSADGTRLAAAFYGGPIRTSLDSGATWTSRSGGGYWIGIASSIDGVRLAACQYGGPIFTAEAEIRTTTMVGPAGWVAGDGNTTIELIYVGNGQFAPLSSLGTLTFQ